MKYIFSIVRFVPDSVRGEFINIGAIIGNEQTLEWQLRLISNIDRALYLDSNGTLPSVMATIASLGKKISRYTSEVRGLFNLEEIGGALVPFGDLNETWLNELYINYRNLVQFSPPMPMSAESMEEAWETINDQFLVEPDHNNVIRNKDKRIVFAALKNAYTRHIGEPERIQQRVLLSTDRYREQLDFAVTNGHAVQLAQTWSFQNADQQRLEDSIKAWAWTIRALKIHGGLVETSQDERYEVDSDVDVQVVYLPPDDIQTSPALKAAENTFDELGIPYFSIDSVDNVGKSARSLLHMN